MVKSVSIDEKVRNVQRILDSIDFNRLSRKIDWSLQRPKCRCWDKERICGHWTSWLWMGIYVNATKPRYYGSKEVIFTPEDENRYRAAIQRSAGPLVYKKLKPYIKEFIKEAKY